MKHNPLLLALASAGFLLSACGSDNNVFVPDGDGTQQQDSDNDGILDNVDNCPSVANPNQADSNNDGVGDACTTAPTDTDGDGVPDATDNCPTTANADQADTDGNGVGDACQVTEEPELPNFVTCEGQNCTITGDVDEDFTMQASYLWTLNGVVRVGDGNVNVANDADVATLRERGVTLTIEPGTNVKATGDGVLLVTRGSKLIAEGTAAAPITFSSADDNFDGIGEWGGIILQGFAPQYGTGNTGACYGTGTVCNVAGEGGTFVGVYGGNDPTDNSGVIKYVRIAEAGQVAGPNNEVNTLTLMGVGYNTVIDYVHLHNSLDDAIEWFGGTVNATHLVFTNTDDDDIDFDQGWKGNVQFAIVQKNPAKAGPTGTNDPRAIEANSSDTQLVPQTEGVLANLTLIGSSQVVNNSAGPQPGALFRGAVHATMVNSAIKGFNTGCVRIQDATVSGNVTASNVTLTNVLGDCQAGMYVGSRQADTANNVSSTTVTLNSGYAVNESAAVLTSAPVITPANNGSSFTFEPTSYVGAVAPGTVAANAWWAGWTIPGALTVADESPGEAPFVSCTTAVCTVTGTIDRDYVFTAGREWFLNGVVKVGNGNVNVASDADVATLRSAGATLTVRPGVSVKASGDGVLLVTRGSKLIADGRSDAPITFSSADNNFDGIGEWGGIIVQGFAPQYGTGNTGACYGSGTVCNVAGEGGTFVGVYGGNDPTDNSGIIRYVRIAEAGQVAGPNNEVNTLTLMGVGYNTVIDYVQLHNSLDDAVEWFGGTVNATHLVFTNTDDDDIDFDQGWKGNVQFAIVRKDPTKAGPTGTNDPRAIEANSSDTQLVPQTNGVLANLTLIGNSQVVNNTAGPQPGALFRGAVHATMANSAIKGFNTGCVRIQDATVSGNVTASNVTLTNVLGDCSSGFYVGSRQGDTVNNAGASTVTLNSAMAMTEATATLTAAPTITPADSGSPFVFTPTTYVGAVAPGTPANSVWWANWTFPNSVVP